MAFKSLVENLSGQRQEIRRALASLPYFDTWEDQVITECCQISTIIEFPPDEIILGPDTKNSHVTFFIVEGICKIIHYIQVRVVTDSCGKTTYKLYKFEDKKPVYLQKNSVKYKSLLFNGNHDFKEEKKIVKIEDNLKVEENFTVKTADVTTFEEKKVEMPNEFHVEETVEPERENEDVESGIKKRNVENEEKHVAIKLKTEENHRDDEKKIEIQTSSEKEATVKEELSQEPTHNGQIENSKETVNEMAKETKKEKEKLRKTYDPDHHLKVLEKCKEKSNELKKFKNDEYVPERPDDVKTFFVQVALFYKGACFGLEEHLKDAFIMSDTKVKCLKIPRRFLLRHNPCNIWNRIRLFFRLYLPPEKKILQHVVSNRKWNNHKRKLSEEIVRRKNRTNRILSTEEVPFSLRLLEVPR